MATPRLVVVPTTDTTFAEDASRLAALAPAGLAEDDLRRWIEAELRRTHPTAVVRPQHELARRPGDLVWYVFRRIYRSRIDTFVDVPLPAEAAFDLYVGRVVEWQSVVELAPLRVSPAIVGDEYEARYTILGRQVVGRFRILAADRPRSLVIEAGGSGISVWYRSRFLPMVDGTRLHVEGDYDLPAGILGQVVDRLFVERTIARDIDRANRSFRALCEAAARGG